MRITHLGHACLLIEMADSRILLDPGVFTADLSPATDLDAILVTHQHPDHLDQSRLPGLRRANPGALLLTWEWHALIHDDIPVIANVGVVFAAEGEPTLYHPGDTLAEEPGPVDVACFPLNAPWQRSREMTAYLRRLAAPRAIPIHDGLLNATGRNLYLSQARSLGCAHTEILDLAGAGTVEVSA
ncbi:MAG: MBL fold metallo-hydrolase [Tetrasphaera sp.]|nr:MBL fold metallo-hydrolase [Tetrasphaera sp.]